MQGVPELPVEPPALAAGGAGEALAPQQEGAGGTGSITVVVEAPIVCPYVFYPDWDSGSEDEGDHVDTTPTFSSSDDEVPGPAQGPGNTEAQQAQAGHRTDA